jgi:hypothetical protein
MLDRTSSPAAVLLGRINAAVAVANDAERRATTAQAELVSRSKAVGVLLLEAKKMHPKVKDFESFLKQVDGLQRSRAYDLMRLAGGRTTDEELKKDARERKQKSRAKKVPPQPEPILKKPEPEPEQRFRDNGLVTESDGTKAAEVPQPLFLGALTFAWRNVEAAAATGRKSDLRTALKRLKFQVNLALDSEALKKTPSAKPAPDDLDIPDRLRRDEREDA